MSLIRQSYKELFQKNCDYNCKLKYSSAFNGFNANIRLFGKDLTIKMSKKWETISYDIQIGLIQSLLLRMFNKKGSTHNIDFYNNFLKNVHIAIPKEEAPLELLASFERVNDRFFHGLIERPNLKFGKGISRLGTYEYGTDTITISKNLFNQDLEILDYVMYHEILHKKYKFSTNNNRTYHHTKQFREKEAEYPNSKEIEVKLQKIVNKASFKRIFPLKKLKLF